MNAIRTIILAITICLAPLANADELLSRNHYGNELDRCVAQIRSDIAAGPETRLEHKVTDVSKDGAWYNFTIVTVGNNGPVTTACRANRFNDDTRVVVESARNDATRLASAA